MINVEVVTISHGPDGLDAHVRLEDPVQAGSYELWDQGSLETTQQRIAALENTLIELADSQLTAEQRTLLGAVEAFLRARAVYEVKRGEGSFFMCDECMQEYAEDERVIKVEKTTGHCQLCGRQFAGARMGL